MVYAQKYFISKGLRVEFPMPADDLLALPDNEEDDGGVDEQHEREKGSEKSPRLFVLWIIPLSKPSKSS